MKKEKKKRKPRRSILDSILRAPLVRCLLTSWLTVNTVHASVVGGFWDVFHSFSVVVDSDPEVVPHWCSLENLDTKRAPCCRLLVFSFLGRLRSTAWEMTLGIVFVFNARGLVCQWIHVPASVYGGCFVGQSTDLAQILTYFVREGGLGSRGRFAHRHHFHMLLVPGSHLVVPASLEEHKSHWVRCKVPCPRIAHAITLGGSCARRCATTGAPVQAVRHCLDVAAHGRDELSRGFLGALDGQQLLVVEGSGS